MDSWRGVSPALAETAALPLTPTTRTPSEHLLSLEPRLGWDPMTLFGAGLVNDLSGLQQFYSGLHGALAAAGVDGVKIDVQAAIPALGNGMGGGPSLAARYTRAMEASVGTHFGPNCINCMCHSTENLYNYRTTAVARASDDFYPLRPDSHTCHIVNVAYNSLFLGEICLPDWDVTATRHTHHTRHIRRIRYIRHMRYIR